eukprot:6487318-Amphidinium_carterae.2
MLESLRRVDNIAGSLVVSSVERRHPATVHEQDRLPKVWDAWVHDGTRPVPGQSSHKTIPNPPTAGTVTSFIPQN